MSSFSDIVKYSATLVMEREKRGHNPCYIGLVIFAALFMLTFQIWVMYDLNNKNDSLLFCGDVIGRLSTDSADPIVLFTEDGVQSFNNSWYKEAERLEKEYQKLNFEKRGGKGDDFAEDDYSISDQSIEDIETEVQGYNTLIMQAQQTYVANLSMNWKHEDISTKTCTASESSSENTADLIRAQNLAIQLQGQIQAATEGAKVTYQDKEVNQDMVDLILVNQMDSKWNCPKDFRNDKGKCQLTWNCSIAEWTTYCDGEMSFASTIESSNNMAWFVGVVILAATITSDLYEHLVVMRQVPWFFKILLTVQCIIAVNIAILNASLCAGQDTPVDILMNSVGLLVLNDMDNIVAQMFLILRNKKEEEDEDLLDDNVEFKDKVFARWLAFPHLIFVAFYASWFLGLFQFSDPEEGLQAITYWQPYSLFFFPPITLIWYIVCYSNQCARIRCKCCFELPVDPENQVDLKYEESQGSARQQPLSKPAQLEMVDVEGQSNN